MTDLTTAALQYAHANAQRFLDDMCEYVKIPSISTDPECKEDMIRAAEWTAARLRSIGAQKVQLIPTPKHPAIFGEIMEAGAAAPTVLVYAHYDVQPADPLELWQSGPFEPQVRGDELFGRGTTDMKGQFLAAVDAIEAIRSAGKLPVNVKFLVEGEEEIGSPNLAALIDAHRDLLAADVSMNPDAGMIAPEMPTITYGLRGLSYFELRLYGPDHDLHSGLFGGTIHNPAQVLCELVAGMHDAQGRVTLPGFYDKVRPLTAEERAELARMPIGDQFYLEQTGAPGLWGEEGFTSVERVGARPTLEVNGLLSGFTGEGSKTVLPAKAMAKVSCRLVPDQDPQEVYQMFIQYLKERMPPTLRFETRHHAGSFASISDRNSAAVEAMAAAMEKVWGMRPVFRREGGSVPVVVYFQKMLGFESVNVGFALPGDNVHAPNEKIHLPTWRRGIDTLIYFFTNLSQ
jgi:acetylornithine deacetylase/succinyl-diaminopimelate desuccinylase-like protein